MSICRVIPCLDMEGGRVVKGVSFVNLRDAGDPVELAALYEREGADELVCLDITASSDGRDTTLDAVRRVASEISIPLAVGGGIRTVEDMRRVLEAGADKVGVNTAAVVRPDLIAEGAKEFGSERIVLAIDANRVENPLMLSIDGGEQKPAEAPFQVYTHGGRKPTSLDPVKWARQGEELGAGEILLTSMNTDGHLTGYDLELTAAVSEAVSIPVIASGGAGTLDHLYEAVTKGKADAVLAASIFHFGTYSIAEVKRFLAERGVQVNPVQ